MVLFILLALMLLAIIGGGWGYTRYGYIGWSPAAIMLLLLLLFWMTGYAGYVHV